MGYVIFIVPKIYPKFISAHGVTGDQMRLNPGPILTRPSGELIYKDHSGLYGDDPTIRVELRQTESGTVTVAEIMAACPRILDKKYADLWEAAHNYEFQQISGSAIGLLTLGVLRSLPKCTVVQAWIKSVWVLYYERKELISFTSEPDLDFTVAGTIPYTIPELMAEVGV
jgi:hypothetical protein